MPRTEKYFIGPQLLGDIRRVVGRVEGTPYRVNGVTRREVHQDMPRPGGGGGGGGVRFAIWTATTNWTVMSILSTAGTSTNNAKVIQWAFPQQTATQGTNTISYSTGETVLCVNNLTRINRLGTATTTTARLLMTVIVAQDGGLWRLVGAEC